MHSAPGHSGAMSQNSARADAHPSSVTAAPKVDAPLRPAIDPAARTARGMYRGLSSSSVGLELGLAVIIGVLGGMWLDSRLGTQPWMMLLLLVLGLVAGFRNVLRAVAREDRANHG